MQTSAAQSRLRPHSYHHAGRRAAAAASAATAAKPKLYNPRHPERTPLYQTIAEHFETWFELASAGQFDGQGDHHTPKPYVRKAFRKYLECVIFAHGFARAWCDACGHDYFVAFSCKGRGVCPSCNARRMVETAARAWSGCCGTARARRLHWIGWAKRAASWSTAAPSSIASQVASHTASAAQRSMRSPSRHWS